MATLTSTRDKVIINSLFKKYDNDNSNTINSFELKNLLTDMGQELTFDQLTAIQMYMDVDSNGKISFDEFYNYWLKLVGDNNFLNDDSVRLYRLTYAANLFRKFDGTGNRRISLSEFEPFYKELYQNYNASMYDINLALNYIDKDKDGEISFQEFINWLNWL
ncbi:hypothetical protein ABK040_005307 [Willaertia magna]